MYKARSQSNVLSEGGEGAFLHEKAREIVAVHGCRLATFTTTPKGHEFGERNTESSQRKISF